MKSAAALAAISAVRTTAEKKAILRSLLEGVLSDPLADGMLSEEFSIRRVAAAIATLDKINAAKDGHGIVVAQIEAMIAFEEIGDFETKDLIANALATVGRR